MDDVQQLKVSRNGGVYLPVSVRDEMGIEAGDLLELRVVDQAIELTKCKPQYHYAEWRSISHALIVEKQQNAA